jgi:large conductance mechanosensitive channel
MGFIKEFREFAVKGNLMDLAVAVVIGAAFSKIVTALVDDIIMPVIGSFIGSSFATLSATINGVEVKYGLFIQATIDFIIVAFVLFIVIKAINRMKKKEIEVIATAKPTSTDLLLMEIRDSLRR